VIFRSLVLALACLPACGVREDLLRRDAARDLLCPGQRLTIERLEGGYLVSGCAKQDLYFVTGEWGFAWTVRCPSPTDERAWSHPPFGVTRESCAELRAAARVRAPPEPERLDQGK
jgi:hypothetical protein